MKSTIIKYPYLPEDMKILYVPESNPYMQEARLCARMYSLDTTVKTGAVLVKNSVIIGRGANGSSYHETHQCERVRLGVPTGQGYELCEGCSPINHAEPRAINDAKSKKNDPDGSDLYLWGHWWCCEQCWNAMIHSGIQNVYLMEGSEYLFNKTDPRNILGQKVD